MRYFEITGISPGLECELAVTTRLAEDASDAAAIDRLRLLNRERLELLTILVHRELRRYLSCAEYERLQLEQRLGC